MYTISYNLNCNPGRWSKQMSLYLLHRPENKQKLDSESETLRSNSNSIICILWPGSYYLTSLSLSFLISKMGTWYYWDFYLKYLAHHLEHGECMCVCVHAHTHARSVTQLCQTLCDPKECRPPGSSVRGILQARILEWVPIPFYKGSSQPRD